MSQRSRSEGTLSQANSAAVNVEVDVLEVVSKVLLYRNYV